MATDDDRIPAGSASAAEDGGWLERLLVAEGAEHRAAYVADEGFTARVMAALPLPADLPAWRKPAVAALWGTAAVGLAIAMPGALLDVGREAYRLLATQPVSLSGIAGAAAAMIGVTWAAAAYTLRSSD
jgi:hypothetical protein